MEVICKNCPFKLQVCRFLFAIHSGFAVHILKSYFLRGVQVRDYTYIPDKLFSK